MLKTVFAAACWLSVSAATDTLPSATPRVKEPVATPAANTTRRNSTTTLFGIANIEQTNGVVLRAFYVIVGVMMIILVYFVVRIVRSRYRRSKTRRYGIIATQSAELEMQPLDRADDEEEETTLFEAGKRWTVEVEGDHRAPVCLICWTYLFPIPDHSPKEDSRGTSPATHRVLRLVFVGSRFSYIGSGPHIWFCCTVNPADTGKSPVFFWPTSAFCFLLFSFVFPMLLLLRAVARPLSPVTSSAGFTEMCWDRWVMGTICNCQRDLFFFFLSSHCVWLHHRAVAKFCLWTKTVCVSCCRGIICSKDTTVGIWQHLSGTSWWCRHRHAVHCNLHTPYAFARHILFWKGLTQMLPFFPGRARAVWHSCTIMIVAIRLLWVFKFSWAQQELSITVTMECL